MIDTHLHILPGIDDGPETIQDALILARHLVREGIHTAIATPHYNDQYPQRSAKEIRERTYEMQEALDGEGIALRLFAGHEVLIKPGLCEDIQAGRVATLNGSRYMLLELWNSMWPPELERVIFELRSIGIVPVLAHPERYAAIQQDPTRLSTLLRQRVLTQLTGSSLIGMQGRTVSRTAHILLKKKLIHCIASDAHDMRRRAPYITQSLRQAEQLMSGQSVEQMTEICPLAILNDVAFP